MLFCIPKESRLALLPSEKVNLDIFNSQREISRISSENEESLSQCETWGDLVTW